MPEQTGCGGPPAGPPGCPPPQLSAAPLLMSRSPLVPGSRGPHRKVGTGLCWVPHNQRQLASSGVLKSQAERVPPVWLPWVSAGDKGEFPGKAGVGVGCSRSGRRAMGRAGQQRVPGGTCRLEGVCRGAAWKMRRAKASVPGEGKMRGVANAFAPQRGQDGVSQIPGAVRCSQLLPLSPRT